MAPDRGSDDRVLSGTDAGRTHDSAPEAQRLLGDNEAEEEEVTATEEAQSFLNHQAGQAQNFTLRSTLVGLAIGVIICFSNTYFGLQTGWISGMAMPAALIGFAFFKTISSYLELPFTPVENVLVQTVAGAVGTMPLGCGFVGVIPALNYLLKPEENGPLQLSTGQLILWSLGICFFGVVFAVPLRREVIIREKLKFPSGTATALVISVLHGGGDDAKIARHECGVETARRRSAELLRSKSRSQQHLTSLNASNDHQSGDARFRAGSQTSHGYGEVEGGSREGDHKDDWKAKIRLLIMAFGISGIYVRAKLCCWTFKSARDWLWTLNPSPAYVGQGIIMGPATTLHMLLGAVVGWAVLSPLAKSKGWADGPVDDWTSGSKGWIVWVSLAIMLADSIISLGWLILRPLIIHGPQLYQVAQDYIGGSELGRRIGLQGPHKGTYTALASSEQDERHRLQSPRSSLSEARLEKDATIELDAPPAHLISNRTVLVLLVLSIALCVVAVRVVFGTLVPFYAIFLSIILALLLSVMGVRAQGETDLNPVSGISKLTQLVFALIIPNSHPNAVTINLLAGAISESGALQAGDMMQDLKAGHLLGASPKAQFYGQMIGSAVGAVVSAVVYKLYTTVYKVPGGLFEVPTGYVWIFTARLVTGKGLPFMAWQWASGAGCLFALMTALRIRGQGKSWQPWVPGGIAVAV
ncbi:MAG: hypothetical protein Q9174_002583, partial [Haloplaca sp. 1 TL-2023]